ncbi:hypothetical protein NKR19_g2171 [Coniochaeta hoffmannii]|uniref:DUF1308 domain-containing protein n=1 Tax=Coniochaeta hoffmannii TaxID=91930 RepID=A0AA38S632_9PEZI|nr:hypothetical protein NKR19_g2171 [Coniochaeta hoffmannii]
MHKHAEDEPRDIHTLLNRARTRAEDIIRRTERLLSEYQQFNDLRQKQRTAVVVPGQKVLVNSAKTEHAAATRMLGELRSRPLTSAGDDDDDAPGSLETVEHICEKLECSNVYSLETAWDVVKRCGGLEQLASRFSLHPSVGPCPLCRSKAVKKCPPKGKQDSRSVVYVDAVVNGGAEWLRIMGIDERRLLHEMAEMGWDWGAEDETDDEDDGCDVSVANVVRQLVAAARANRHEYRPPRLHLVFTRIAEGSNPEIDRLIRKLRAIPRQGVELQIDCADSQFLTAPPPLLDAALQTLVAEDLSNITSTVNLDCSILVALASDVTHSDIDIQPWHRNDVVVQIREEAELGSSLVKALYPVLRSRRLVCTAKAAQRFWEIVDTIATEAEAARAEIILPRSRSPGKTTEELVAELQALSAHPVDPDLRLPIGVVDHGVSEELVSAAEPSRLPRSAEFVSPILSELNRDIYLYGWLQDITTMTANNSLAKQIRMLVEEQRTDDDEAGPKIWVFPFTRALATKGRPAARGVS